MKKQRCEPRMELLYRLIPAYPEEISLRELAQKMNTSSTDVAMLIGRFRTSDPICEFRHKFCYVGTEERKLFLNVVEEAARKGRKKNARQQMQ